MSACYGKADLDRPVKENPAGIASPAGRELLSHGLGILVTEDSPHRRHGR
jgi:hypothetical protein